MMLLCIISASEKPTESMMIQPVKYKGPIVNHQLLPFKNEKWDTPLVLME